MNELNIKNHDDDIQIKELLLIIWKKKVLVFSIISSAIIISVTYALSLPNIYSSNALLAESNPTESLTSKINEFSPLASIAGINIPNTSSSKIDEAIERINSYDFFLKEFLPYIKYEDLVAAESWNQTTNTILYKEKLFNSSEMKWIMNKPSHQEAFEIYNSNLSVSRKKDSGFVSITIMHVSPNITKQWLNTIIKNINDHMREIDRIQAKNSIDFLNQTASKTNINQIKEAISGLLENQIQTLMMVESNEDYIFKQIISPIAPEKKSGPARSVIVLFGLILGTFFAILIPILLHYWSSNKNSA